MLCNLPFNSDDLFSSTSEKEEAQRKRGGSKPCKKVNINRDRSLHDSLLQNQYFNEHPVYDDSAFSRPFHASWSVYNRSKTSVIQNDKYFVQKRDCTGELDHSPDQKFTTEFCLLAYDVSSNALEENIGVSARTDMESLFHFVDAINSISLISLFKNLQLQIYNDC